MGQPVVHFEIHTHNSEQLRSFYSELFGWKLHVVPDGTYSLVDTESDGIGIPGAGSLSRSKP